ncbi:uncharacterized protein ATNIH1004_003671 [Aspergillus tanneri]|uniref:Uncharacterized protein n=1 Tax=Aspergillus tanneri TaxID=1220188 RepID=A0A5M9N050_9EURO|nr:uncharacterized protein ATNIH1004_003671 [Aspergillus tanneri]KAA8650980.1 hypothetical protein ATNIH1004_003671 [Aspergillus tanneri]
MHTVYTTFILVTKGLLSTTVVFTIFLISEVNYQQFTIASSKIESVTVNTYKPSRIQVPSGRMITSPPGEVNRPLLISTLVGLPPITTTTSSDPWGCLFFTTWLSTVGYSPPLFITPIIPAPTKIPGNDNSLTPTPDLGVNDCTGNGCTKGPDCTNNDCLHGGDYTGPSSTRGGDSTSPKSIPRGEVGSGENCMEGGHCSGDYCVSGGGCSGAKCNRGGGCSGSNCNKGGGCIRTLLESCSSGPCIGPSCVDNTDCAWYDNQVTITVQPGGSPVLTGKPTCLTKYPLLSPCVGGNTSCNVPCNIKRCPANSMPMAKGCSRAEQTTGPRLSTAKGAAAEHCVEMDAFRGR